MKPLRDQDGAKCYRQDEDCGEQALAAHQPHAHGNGYCKKHADDGYGNRQPQRRADGLVEVGVGEELAVIGQRPTTIQRIEGQHQPVKKRIDEHAHHKKQRGQDQKGNAIEAAIGEALPQAGP